MNKRVTQKERVIEFLNKQKISKNKFYTQTGIANGTLDKKSGITGDTIKKIYTAYPEINLEWLIMGEGDMLKSSAFISKNNLKLIRNKYAEITNLDPGNIPEEDFIMEKPLDVVPIFSQNRNRRCEGYLSIPKLTSYDGASYVKTDSMYPLIKPGDIICYKMANNGSPIYWGEMYVIHMVIEGDEYITIKNIEKSQMGEDYVCLGSYNQKYGKMDVLAKDILWKAIIKAHISYNSIL